MTRDGVGERLFDVAVIGGGPAGAAATVRLADAGMSVLLCDAARFPRHKICGEYVPPAALELMEELGLREEVERLGPRRHIGMAVIAPGGTKVLGRYPGKARYGLSIRRYDLDHVLFQRGRRSAAKTLEGFRLVGLTRRDDGAFDLDLNSTAPGTRTAVKRVRARSRTILGADGRNSMVARWLGLRRPEPGHRRWAVMGHFRAVRAPADHGEMIVTPYGYCGINPLPAGLANVCLVLDPGRPGGSLPGRPGLESFFRERIASHPLTRRAVAGAVLADGLWTTGPLACRTARSFADGALLAGDAAGFYDPFTGEGIAMALRGGVLAAETLCRALKRGDVSAAALAPYETERHRAFAARLRFDRALQGVLKRPRLADWVAVRLRRDQRLADLVAGVAGDVTGAAAVLSPGFIARLLLA